MFEFMGNKYNNSKCRLVHIRCIICYGDTGTIFLIQMILLYAFSKSWIEVIGARQALLVQQVHRAPQVI